MTDKRLIEVAFPLKQTSIDSVHEKNVRHGHISTLHIWPARRPLAACRAALIATLLPDPGDKTKRDEILKRLGGTLIKALKKKTLPNGRVEEIETWETEGGILHWGRESGPDLQWFRDEIRKAYGGRAPKVLDPFAGGGAIPLEAMRLGCEVTAVDINPVAWFILKCTLEYPQKLAGQKRRLPEFVLHDAEFMGAYFKAKGMGAAAIKRTLQAMAADQQSSRAAKSNRQPEKSSPSEASVETERNQTADLFAADAFDHQLLEADLAWHVRAWGQWVLKEARQKLARYYPSYAEYCTVKPYARVPLAREDQDQLKFVPVNDAGEPQIALLNSGFDEAYLGNPKNPRWIAKPTVAYLWARTVKCKACRAMVPLLKTRWLCRKERKRILLTIAPNADRTGVEFGIDNDVRSQGGNAAQKREHDKKIGAGTISRAGVQCAVSDCGTIMTIEDIQIEARAGNVGEVLIAAVVESPDGKEYRVPTYAERSVAPQMNALLDSEFSQLAFGDLYEPISPERPSPNTRGVSGLTRYGVTSWREVFSDRHRLAIASLAASQRSLNRLTPGAEMGNGWSEAIKAYLACALSRFADRSSVITTWQSNAEQINHTFARYVLQLPWDYVESNPLADSSGGFGQAVDWVAKVLEHTLQGLAGMPEPNIIRGSAICSVEGQFDQIVTDPPYYDAIPYSDLMDFFHIWIRRTLHGISKPYSDAFLEPLGPKWSEDEKARELVDQPGRLNHDVAKSKAAYEAGMALVFQQCWGALAPAGRLVVVFANKSPDAWEALVSALVRAGFTVDASWPIQTERAARTNALTSATLASSIWLVCRKRDPTAKAGWDEKVLAEMEANITLRLRDFWDAGIRGPDFVWSATGPALEAYSQYPAVKKASEPGQLMSVSEFLGHVRRMVVNFVVGRVLTRSDDAVPGEHLLDDITTYYLLHRNDFGLKDAPAGACILYAVSCGMSERDLTDQFNLLSRGGASADPEEQGEDTEDAGGTESSGGQFKLKTWSARKHRSLGLESSTGRAPPLIDQIHKLMQLWQAGDVNKVNDFLDARGQRRNPLFAQVIQALIEKSREEKQSEECALLERLANHIRGLGATVQERLALPQ